MIERQEGDKAGFFHRRMPLIAALAILCAAASLYFALQGEQRRTGGPAPATTSYSYSALGFRAYYELLGEAGFDTSRNRLERGLGSLSDYLAIVPAPRSWSDVREAVNRLSDARAILVVAPKRYAQRSPEPALRVEHSRLLGLGELEGVLRALDPDLQAYRLEAAPSATMVDRVGIAPAIAQFQLADHPTATPILSYALDKDSNASLVLELQADSPRIWLLADADPVSNHGIGYGNNGLFAVRLAEALAGPQRLVMFDEVANGGVIYRPSAFAALFELPWLALTIALAALIAVIGLAATRRFGTPKEAAVGIAAGRLSLIRATARMQRGEAAKGAALAAYVRRTLREVGHRRHAPALDDAGLAEWLDALAERAGLGAPEAAHLLDQAKHWETGAASRQGDVLAVARRVHRWRMDMLNATARRPAHPH